MSTHRDITEMEPRELVRGFMHGDRPSLKLGYSWENAALAAGRVLDGSEHADHEDANPGRLVAYARGFAAGMKDEMAGTNPYEPDDTRGAFIDGFNDGQDTDVMRAYPG